MRVEVHIHDAAAHRDYGARCLPIDRPFLWHFQVFPTHRIMPLNAANSVTHSPMAMRMAEFPSVFRLPRVGHQAAIFRSC
jgi:hypothetical protein